MINPIIFNINKLKSSPKSNYLHFKNFYSLTFKNNKFNLILKNYAFIISESLYFNKFYKKNQELFINIDFLLKLCYNFGSLVHLEGER